MDSDTPQAPLELTPEEVDALVDDWMLGLLGLECYPPQSSDT